MENWLAQGLQFDPADKASLLRAVRTASTCVFLFGVWLIIRGAAGVFDGARPKIVADSRIPAIVYNFRNALSGAQANAMGMRIHIKTSSDRRVALCGICPRERFTLIDKRSNLSEEEIRLDPCGA